MNATQFRMTQEMQDLSNIKIEQNYSSKCPNSHFIGNPVTQILIVMHLKNHIVA